MKTQLDAMVEFLSGQDCEESCRIRSELTDPQSEAARFLTAAQRLSREVLGDHVFKGLGLPLVRRGPACDVPSPPASAGQRFLRILPWLTTVLASGVVLWLLATCRCHYGQPDGATQERAVERAPAVDSRPNSLPFNPVPDKIDLPANEAKEGPRGNNDDGIQELLRQVADIFSRLEAEQMQSKSLRGQLAELQNKLRMAEAENQRLRPRVASVCQDLRGALIDKEKQREESARLKTQLEQIRHNQASAMEAATNKRTAQLQGDLGAALHKLQVEQEERDRLQKQVDIAAKSGRTAKKALEKLQSRLRELSKKLEASERANQTQRKETTDQNAKGEKRRRTEKSAMLRRDER